MICLFSTISSVNQYNQQDILTMNSLYSHETDSENQLSYWEGTHTLGVPRVDLGEIKLLCRHLFIGVQGD